MEATGKKTRKKLRTNCEVIMGRNLWKKLGIERNFESTGRELKKELIEENWEGLEQKL